MPWHQPLFERAAELRRRFVGDSGYAIAYGSHATGFARTSSSDLDLVFVTPTPLSSTLIARLVDAVVDLHLEFGLDLDTEVAHEVKLHATFTDVRNAVSLRQFVAGSSRLAASAVVAEASYLNSEEFRLRLLFNALTSPHVFLGGAVDSYDDHCRQAERALAILAQALANDRDFDRSSDAMDALLSGTDGSTGKDYLGYLAGPHLYSALSRGRARLDCAHNAPSNAGREHSRPETMGRLPEGGVVL